MRETSKVSNAHLNPCSLKRDKRQYTRVDLSVHHLRIRLRGVRLIRAVSLIILLGPFAWAQNQNPTSDLEALALTSKAIAAMTGNQVIHDITLTGNITRSVGSTDEGTVTLKAAGGGETRIDMTLSDGLRTEIRDDSTGIAQGEWIDSSGKSNRIAFHNALTDAAWFFPALGSLAGEPGVVLSYVGQETRHGIMVEHIRSYASGVGEGTIPDLRKLSTMNFYLDASTLLPVAEQFDLHPDNNELVNLPVEVDFSDYKKIQGVAVPMHIQRRIQGHLIEDIVVTGASINTGIPLSIFALN